MGWCEMLRSERPLVVRGIFGALLISALGFLPVWPASALTVTLNDYEPTRLTTLASDGVAPASVTEVLPASTPYLDTLSNVDGAASNSTQYSLLDSGFHITFEHARTALYDSQAISNAGVSFRVDEDVSYELLGSYAAIDSDGRRISLFAQLADRTSLEQLFYNSQESRSTPDESFLLGGEEGDFINSLNGSTTGVLIAGHDYLFSFQASLQASPSAATTSATASGWVSLDFTPVPEPSAGALLLLGLVFALSRGRRT